jgi:hypothetical protein
VGDEVASCVEGQIVVVEKDVQDGGMRREQEQDRDAQGHVMVPSAWVTWTFIVGIIVVDRLWDRGQSTWLKRVKWKSVFGAHGN